MKYHGPRGWTFFNPGEEKDLDDGTEFRFYINEQFLTCE